MPQVSEFNPRTLVGEPQVTRAEHAAHPSRGIDHVQRAENGRGRQRIDAGSLAWRVAVGVVVLAVWVAAAVQASA